MADAATEDGVLSIKSMNAARKAKRRCDAIITIEDPRVLTNRKLRFQSGLPHPPQLILRFEDVDDEDPELATAQPIHVERALDFARQQRGKHLLIHCHAGVSRSTAIAYAILCDRLGPGQESIALDKVFEIRPAACPNLLVTRLADALLGREGRILETLMQRIGTTESLRSWVKMRREFLERNPTEYAPRDSINENPVLMIGGPCRAENEMDDLAASVKDYPGRM